MSPNDNSSGNDYEISVSAEKLGEAALHLKNVCNDILLHIGNIEKSVFDSSYYWSTESSELVQRLFADDAAESKAVAEKIKEYIKSLDSITQLYEKTERESTDDAQTLPDSIIDW